MFRSLGILSLIFLLSGESLLAAPAKKVRTRTQMQTTDEGLRAPTSSRTRSRSSRTKVTTKKVKTPRVYWHRGAGVTVWQEAVKATRPPESTDIRMQFQGIQARLSYHRPFTRSNWRLAYLGDATFGLVKGKGTAPTIDDGLKGHMWLQVNVTPSLIFRTSRISEVAFGIPLTARYIDWRLEKGSNLTMDKGFSFSTGMTAIYANRLSSTMTLTFSLTHQYLWKANIWAFGLEQRF